MQLSAPPMIEPSTPFKKKPLRGQSTNVAAKKAVNAQRKRILLALDPDLFDQIESKASQCGMNVTELITHTLKKFIAQIQ